MADPLWINTDGGAPSYTANELRQAMALGVMYDGRAMGGRQGVRPGGTQLHVTLDGSTITVQPGLAYVDPALSTPQGGYWVAIPTTENPEGGPLQPADATNPRKDIVVLRVYDHDEDSTTLRTARTEYIAGTAGPSPAEPAVPAGAVRVATIDVPASGGGTPVVTNSAPLTVAPGGILPVYVAADIAAGVNGRYRHRLDTGVLELDTGSVWVPVADAASYAVVQDTTPGTVSSGFTVNSALARTTLRGKDVYIALSLVSVNERPQTGGSNIADVTCYTLDADFRPTEAVYAVIGSGNYVGLATINTSGTVVLRAAAGGIGAGDSINLTARYLRS